MSLSTPRAARGGLHVTSVIAAAEHSALDVLMAAHHIATSEAVERGSVERCSLFDLSPGEDELWTITVEDVSTYSIDGREERFRTFMPAWSAESSIDLADPTVGFPAAASALAAALGLDQYILEAKQAAVARYGRVGFEAAAVTSMAIALSARVERPGIRRVAELRFGHPYAVVAVTTEESRGDRERGPWHGLPVFSAWISDPVDATAATFS